jgi:hypothetical protein
MVEATMVETVEEEEEIRIEERAPTVVKMAIQEGDRVEVL